MCGFIIRIMLVSMCLWASPSVYSSVSRSPEHRAADALADSVRLYHKFVGSDPVVGWSQIAQAVPNLDSFKTLLPAKDITLLYSFIPLSDRDKFPKGELIAVSSAPLPWPDINKEEGRGGVVVNSDSYQPIRYVIYKNSKAEFVAERWYDKDFAEMIAEKGIRIPDPTHYNPPLVLPYGADFAEENSDKTRSPEGVAMRSPTPVASEADASQRLADTTNNTSLWILGVVAALVLGCLIVIGVRKRR